MLLVLILSGVLLSAKSGVPSLRWDAGYMGLWPKVKPDHHSLDLIIHCSIHANVGLSWLEWYVLKFYGRLYPHWWDTIIQVVCFSVLTATIKSNWEYNISATWTALETGSFELWWEGFTLPCLFVCLRLMHPILWENDSVCLHLCPVLLALISFVWMCGVCTPEIVCECVDNHSAILLAQ